MTFRAQAFGADDQLLQAASASSRVTGEEPSGEPVAVAVRCR